MTSITEAVLPPYTVTDPRKEATHPLLCAPSKELTFPLSFQDLNDAKILEMAFDAEENCLGLAAVQIGIAKRMFIFAIAVSEEAKRWRPDLVQSFPKSLWVNPSYEPMGDEKTKDYEGCFSVEGVAGLVERPTSIRYRAFTLDGAPIEGEAHGFAARVIQHETDHTNGILFTHIAESIISTEEYQELRRKAIDGA